MESVWYCGLDLSITSTGLAVVEFLGDRKFRLITKKTIAPRLPLKGFDRRVDSIETFKLACATFEEIQRCKFFVIENYSFGSPGRITDLAELGGLYKYYISEGLKKGFDLIPPQTVKKQVTGNGRSDKIAVREGLKNFLINYDEINWENYDESDAVAVAIAYGLLMIEKISEQKAEQNSVESEDEQKQNSKVVRKRKRGTK